MRVIITVKTIFDRIMQKIFPIHNFYLSKLYFNITVGSRLWIENLDTVYTGE